MGKGTPWKDLPPGDKFTSGKKKSKDEVEKPKPKKEDRRKQSRLKHKKAKQLAAETEAEDPLANPKPSLKTEMEIDSASTEDTSQTFEQWYLRQVTKEFADDLDKIRQSKDFSESSLPMLIFALKQGAELLSEEERARIMGRPS